MKVLLLNEKTSYPTKGSIASAGFDVKSPDNFIIKQGETLRIQLGIAIEINKNEVAIMSERSSMGAKGVFSLGNVIDSDYRGEISIILNNTSKEDFVISQGDRIGQILVLQLGISSILAEGVSKLSETQRGNNGFGSTGK